MTLLFPLPLQDLLDKIIMVLHPTEQAFLVGGALRDTLLGLPTYDLDIALSADAIGVARRVADSLGGAFYPLDEERDTARVLLFQPDGSRQILDFAGLRGPDIKSDLRARDFTINALAVALKKPQVLLDPLGGAKDLRAGILRACSDGVFIDDPLRILRGVRQATAYRLRMQPETIRLMRRAIHLLPRISAERVRDEIFRILDGDHPAANFRVMDTLGVLDYIFPEIAALKGVEQSAPHHDDVWSHTINVVSKLEKVLNVLSLQHDPEEAANWHLGFISVQLGRYREEIHQHLVDSITTGRSQRALLFLAALYHDSGKAETGSMDDNGQIRFFKHEIAGWRLIENRARVLRLSNQEIKHVETIVRNHMRPFYLVQAGPPPNRRSVYRFFRDTGPAGVDICMLSLADTLATYGPALPREIWADHLTVVRSLLDAWYERQDEEVYPRALLKGGDLINHFGVSPGPQIGELLDVLREAQAAGDVSNRDQALELAESWLKTREETTG